MPEAKAVSGTIVQADDFTDIAGVPDLVAEGVKKVREGMKLGSRMGSLSQDIAELLLSARMMVVNPKTGLPDLRADTRRMKDIAHAIYAPVAKEIGEDDHDSQRVHAALRKSVQNRSSDVLVAYLRAFDNSSAAVLRKSFPAAAELRKVNKKLSPSEAIYQVYADKGVQLPRKGRTELTLQRYHQLTDGGTDQERAFFAIDRVTSSLTSLTSRADQMTPDERSDLKTKLQETITTLAAEASKL